MVKIFKALGILFLGLAIFVMNNCKIDGLQGLLEMMAFTFPSYLISFTAGVIILLITKKEFVGSIVAVLVILFMSPTLFLNRSVCSDSKVKLKIN